MFSCPMCREPLFVVFSMCTRKHASFAQVITLHSFDAYLAPAPSWGSGAGALERILHHLDKHRHQIGTVPLAMVEFGGTPRNSSLLVAAWLPYDTLKVPTVLCNPAAYQ